MTVNFASTSLRRGCLIVILSIQQGNLENCKHIVRHVIDWIGILQSYSFFPVIQQEKCFGHSVLKSQVPTAEHLSIP